MEQESRARSAKLLDISQKGACPICTSLKEVQSDYIRSLDRRVAPRLCNFHTWLVAKLADAGTAADVFLCMLERPLEEGSGHKKCDLCAWMEQQEQRKFEELAQKLSRPKHPEGLRQHAELCVPHSRKMLGRVPKELQAAITLAVQRQAAELKGRLTTLSRDARTGKTIHPGLLGRAAEYLVAMRGLVVKP